jgi:DNA polymerase III epsilon subunit-like protein
MSDPKILVLDTETTGVEGEIGVVEIAWVELDPDDLSFIPDTEHLHLTNPLMPINCGAAGVHGIRDEDITDDLPTLADLEWPEGEVVLVCHNVKFDRPLVEEYLNIAGSLCTYLLSVRSLPDAPDHKLPTLGCYCDLPRNLAHRALGDVRTTVAPQCGELMIRCIR